MQGFRDVVGSSIGRIGSKRRASLLFGVAVAVGVGHVPAAIGFLEPPDDPSVTEADFTHEAEAVEETDSASPVFVDDSFVVSAPDEPGDPIETIATDPLSIPFSTCSCGVDGLTWGRGDFGTSDWAIHGVTDRGVRKLPHGYALFDARENQVTRYVERGDVLTRKWSPLAGDAPPFLRKSPDGIVDPRTGAVYRETVGDWFAPATNDAGCSIAWDPITHLPSAVFDREGAEVIRFGKSPSGKTITAIEFATETGAPTIALDYVYDAQGASALSRVQMPGTEGREAFDYVVERGADSLSLSSPHQAPVELSFYPGTGVVREKTVGDATTHYEVFREGEQWAVKIIGPGGQPALWSGTGATAETCPLYDYTPTATGGILRASDGTGPALEVGVDSEGVRLFEIETSTDGTERRREFDGTFDLPVRESGPEGSYLHAYDELGRHIQTQRESDGVVLTRNTWAGEPGAEYLLETFVTDGAGYEWGATDDGSGSRREFERLPNGRWSYSESRALPDGGFEIVQASPEGVKRLTGAEDGTLLAEEETSVEEALPTLPALAELSLDMPVEVSTGSHCLTADGSVDFGCDGQ